MKIIKSLSVGFEPNCDGAEQTTMLTLYFEDGSDESLEVTWTCDLEAAEVTEDEKAVQQGVEWLQKHGADSKLVDLFKLGGVTASGTDKYWKYGGDWHLN